MFCQYDELMSNTEVRKNTNEVKENCGELHLQHSGIYLFDNESTRKSISSTLETKPGNSEIQILEFFIKTHKKELCALESTSIHMTA